MLTKEKCAHPDVGQEISESEDDKEEDFSEALEVFDTSASEISVISSVTKEFLTCSFIEPDCTLLVGGHLIEVSKESNLDIMSISCAQVTDLTISRLLSAYSSYFKTLFFGEFREKNQDVVELQDVSATEFLHLLEAIYPPLANETENVGCIFDNVECLLRLADIYQVKAVTERCAKYLKTCTVSEVPLHKKLIYAQDYRLSELLDHCIKQFKVFTDVKSIRETAEYLSLSDKIKVRIYENVS